MRHSRRCFRKRLEKCLLETRSGEPSREPGESLAIGVSPRGIVRQIEDRSSQSPRIAAIDSDAKPVATHEVTEKASVVHDHGGAHCCCFNEDSGHSIVARVREYCTLGSRKDPEALDLGVGSISKIDLRSTFPHGRCVQLQS